MVATNNQQSGARQVVEYPLKVVEIEQFFLNFDNLVWQKFTKDFTNLVKSTAANETTTKTASRANTNCYITSCCDVPSNYDESKTTTPVNDDTLARSSVDETSRPNLALEYNPGTPSLTLLFIDSDVLRQTFEKSHLKLVNNIIVLDRLSLLFFHRLECYLR